MSTPPPRTPNDGADDGNDETPTEAFPPNTGGYGAAYVAPTAPPLPPLPPVPPAPPLPPAPHAPGAQAPYGRAPYAQAPYGAAAPGPQPGVPAPGQPDTRPKTIAWTALSLALVGTLLSIVGLVPIAWVGLVAVLIGGLLLLAGFIFAIVGLAGKRHGGKALSITALVLSILGATIGCAALIWSIIMLGVTAVSSSIDESFPPQPVPSVEVTPMPGPTAGDSGTDTGAESDAEQAFIADVRPRVNDILLEVDPTATSDLIEEVLPDQTLISIGQTLLVTGDAGVESLVQQTISSFGADESSADLLRTLYREILDSASTHLQER